MTSFKRTLQRLTLHARKQAIADAVMALVSTQLDIPLRVVLSSRRTAPVCWARHCGMVIAKELTDLPLQEIASLFNRDDHATVSNAIKHVNKERATSRHRRIEFAKLKRLALDVCRE